LSEHLLNDQAVSEAANERKSPPDLEDKEDIPPDQNLKVPEEEEHRPLSKRTIAMDGG
jgi:hypothetical protein